MHHASVLDALAETGAAGSDQLGASVLQSLTRSLRGRFSLSAVQAIGLGLLTFGLLPLLRLHRDLRSYGAFESQQMWHAAEWVRIRNGGQDASALAEHAGRMRDRSGDVFFTATSLLALAAAAFTLFLTMGDHPAWRALIERTYAVRSAASMTPAVAMGFIAWNIGVGAAYILHWLRVRIQVKRLRGLADRFNAVALRDDITPLSEPQQRLGLTIAWIIGAAVSCAVGAFWAIPMALAGASQRVYINETSGQLRTELLERLQAMLSKQRPAVAVPHYTIEDRRCPNALCLAPLRVGARFCPRCGTVPDGGSGMPRASGSV